MTESQATPPPLPAKTFVVANHIRLEELAIAAAMFALVISFVELGWGGTTR